MPYHVTAAAAALRPESESEPPDYRYMTQNSNYTLFRSARRDPVTVTCRGRNGCSPARPGPGGQDRAGPAARPGISGLEIPAPNNTMIFKLM